MRRVGSLPRTLSPAPRYGSANSTLTITPTSFRRSVASSSCDEPALRSRYEVAHGHGHRLLLEVQQLLLVQFLLP